MSSSTISSSSSSHVGVFPFPFTSHPSKLLHLIKHLATSSPNILFTVFSTPNANAPFFSNNTTTIGNPPVPPNIKSFDIWDGVPEGHLFRSDVNRHFQEVELFLKSAPETLRKAVAKVEAETGKKITSMVGHPFLYCVADIADELGVPWIANWTSGKHPLAVTLYIDVIREKMGVYEQAVDRDDQHLSFIPGFSNIRVRDVPAGYVSKNPESLSIYTKMISEMAKQLTSSRAAIVLINTIEELDPEVTSDLKSKFDGRLLCIGPYSLLIPPPNKPLPDPHSCIPWLDRHPPNSVLYIGFGTEATPSAAETLAMTSAIQEVGVRFLWSLKTDKASDLPPSFLNWARDSGSGLVVPWTPQAEVLEHQAVGAFLTHFGWGAVTESVGNGVPLIGRPFHGDQLVNARLVESVWGVGLVVADGGGEMTKEGLVRALEKVVVGDGGGAERKRIIENVARMKELFRKAAEPGGSSRENLNSLVKVVTEGIDPFARFK